MNGNKSIWRERSPLTQTESIYDDIFFKFFLTELKLMKNNVMCAVLKQGVSSLLVDLNSFSLSLVARYSSAPIN